MHLSGCGCCTCLITVPGNAKGCHRVTPEWKTLSATVMTWCHSQRGSRYRKPTYHQMASWSPRKMVSLGGGHNWPFLLARQNTAKAVTVSLNERKPMVLGISMAASLPQEELCPWAHLKHDGVQEQRSSVMIQLIHNLTSWLFHNCAAVNALYQILTCDINIFILCVNL